MIEKEKETLRKIITNKIQQLEVDIEDLKSLTAPIAPENSIGRISRMDAINNKSIDDATLLKRKERLKKLMYALEQLGEKDFGVCVLCKKEIEFERLQIMPESKICVQCIKKSR